MCRWSYGMTITHTRHETPDHDGPIYAPLLMCRPLTFTLGKPPIFNTLGTPRVILLSARLPLVPVLGCLFPCACWPRLIQTFAYSIVSGQPS
jgi:hypothetical protein